jgi:site-specific DNA-methyltransferase (adenine-specific)
VVLFGSQPFTTDLIMSNRKWFRYCWVWDKAITGNPFLAEKQPLKVHEDICVFASGQSPYFPQMTKGKLRTKGGYTSGEMFSIDRTQSVNDQYYPVSILQSGNGVRGEHPTQKPVPLCEYLIRTYTNEGETVLDNTMGSGSTGVAAVRTNRNFIGMELDETYYNIARQRIESAQQPLFT